MVTRKLADLKKYIAKGGVPNVVVFHDLASGTWFLDSTDHLGAEQLNPDPLLSYYCASHHKAHVLALLGAGASADGHGLLRTPLVTAAANGRPMRPAGKDIPIQ